MAQSNITYIDKVTSNPRPTIPEENKVTGADMTEIKTVVNANATDTQSQLDSKLEANTLAVQTVRPLKTLNSKSLEGTGNETLDGTEIELINNGGVTVTQAVSDLSAEQVLQGQDITNLSNDKADQSDLDLTNSQVLNNTTALDLKVAIATNPSKTVKGAIKAFYDATTSTLEISIDGINIA